MHVATIVAHLAASTPDPRPTVDPELVTPGPIGFAAIAFVAIAAILLIFDMLRRIRRGRYRSEVNEDLDAEEQARAAERATETDDEHIDPVDDPGRR